MTEVGLVYSLPRVCMIGVQCSGLRVWGSGSLTRVCMVGVQGSGLRVWGSGSLTRVCMVVILRLVLDKIVQSRLGVDIACTQNPNFQDTQTRRTKPDTSKSQT